MDCIAIIDTPCTRAVINRNTRTEVIRCSTDELESKNHFRQSRDFNTVCTHVVPSDIITKHAVNLEATLSDRDFRGDSERCRLATRRTLLRPNCIQRIGRGCSIECAESFAIERTDDRAASLIESPTRQASVRASHNIERLQALRFSNTCNRVSFAVLHVRAVEYGTILVVIFVVSELVRILQERRLDRAEVCTDGEHVAIVVIRPACRSGRTLDLNLRIHIENDTSHIANDEFDTVERHIAMR